MNYGLNISASGVMTSLYRQNVLSNNLANVGTPGFKPDLPYIKQREAVRREDGLMNLPSNRLLERLGAGALLGFNRTSSAQGDLEVTGNPLDAAIRGAGYFVVEASARDGEKRIRLSRDGRFTLNEEGTLVTAASGLAVLDESGRTITIDRSAGPVSIGGDGSISQGGRPLARIQVSRVRGEPLLRKIGNNLYEPTSAQVQAMEPASGVQVVGGSIERSAVDPVQAIMGITDAGNAVASNARMIQLQDDMIGRAINTFGRVA
ncbi:MAG: flagellar hook-basal body protein [Phycisphaerales bacterium]